MTSPSSPTSPIPSLSWKENWAASHERFLNYWKGNGFLIGSWDPPVGDAAREQDLSLPPAPRTPIEHYTNIEWRARTNHNTLNRAWLGLDILPISDTSIGPGSLALLVGCEPEVSSESVWYTHIWKDATDLHNLPSLAFDPDNKWWQVHKEQARQCVNLGQGKYLTGFPDLIENIDILASLRGNENMLMDMIDEPEWVKARLAEINQVWFEAYQGLYDTIKLEDGSSVFWAFMAYGPGKAGKVQCDACAMISPAMFEEFVSPMLAEQCDWLDQSLYHLDGSECLDKLDALLAIPSLDVIEWTPDPNVPNGGDEHWFPMYRKILDAGKRLQIIRIPPERVIPILDAIGTNGVYMLAEFENAAEARDLEDALVSRYGYKR